MTSKTVTTQSTYGEEYRKGHKILGVSLIGIGIIWFAKKIGWIPVVAGGSTLFWPAVTIAIGVLIAVSSRHQRKRNRGRDLSSTGGNHSSHPPA